MVQTESHCKDKWQGGSALCDFCGEGHDWFVDGRTKTGTWAIMCSRHFRVFGVGLGLGKGQKYDLSTLEKIEG